jgi:hypothetical protein
LRTSADRICHRNRFSANERDDEELEQLFLRLLPRWSISQRAVIGP